jgi:hypothetical protein
MATAKGQESFIDKPSSGDVIRTNGVFDEGEFFSSFDLPEAFVDHNRNGVFDAVNCNDPGEAGKCEFGTSTGGHNETYLDANNDFAYTAADGKYNGLLCSEVAEQAGLCSKDLVDVRRDLELVIAGDVPYVRFVVARSHIGGDGVACVSEFDVADPDNPGETIKVERPVNGLLYLEETEDPNYCDIGGIDLNEYDPAETAATGTDKVDVEIYYSDIFGNSLPTGTTINITADNGAVAVQQVDTIVNSADLYGIKKAIVTVSRETASNSKTNGNLTITFTIPSPIDGQGSVVVTHSIPVVDAG